jgi:phosphocarrier protein FPr
MLSLSLNDIQLNQSAVNKQNAIKDLAASLTNKAYVESGYIDGMLAREEQNSTFLGNGIAIPHGTTDTRDLVKQTGVQLHHFPQGVDWGNGQTVYLAIGIAAKSDEHLGILKQLTKVLSAEGVEQKLQQCTTAEEIIALLDGSEQLQIEFDGELVQLAFPATDLLQLTAVAAGLLKNKQCIDNVGVADVIASGCCYLGQGLWMAKTDKMVMRTGLAFVTPAQSFSHENQSVKGLLMFTACNGVHKASLARIVDLVYKQQVDKLFNASVDAVISLLTEADIINVTSTESADAVITGVFTIHNAHGLHARPSAMLIHAMKPFTATIRVTTTSGKSINAKSLMKLMSLGVTCGDELTFTAQGDDAAQALEAIKQAIAAGLGEGK